MTLVGPPGKMGLLAGSGTREQPRLPSQWMSGGAKIATVDANGS